MTTRLSQTIEAIGLATCGELGARFAPRLGIVTSPTTILRRTMALSPGPSEPVSLLGIDDWSFRRGRQFGTILVNLATHEIIDLLPDRKTETAQSWMKGHPEIDVVSRDRGEEYAAVQMEAVHCRFRNKYLPLFGPYCWKSGSSDDQFGTNTCRHSQFGSNTLPSFEEQ